MAFIHSRLRYFTAVLLAACLLSGAPALAGPEDSLFFAAKTIYETAQTEDQDARASRYQSVQQLLDQIVKFYPDTDLAKRIAAKETIDGVNVAEIDTVLNSAGAGGTATAETGAAQQPAPPEAPAGNTDGAQNPFANATTPQPPAGTSQEAQNPFAGNTTGQGGTGQGGTTQGSGADNPFAAAPQQPETGDASTAQNPFAATGGQGDSATPPPSGDGGSNPFAATEPAQGNSATSGLPGAGIVATDADQFDEVGLQLNRSARREIQLRLKLIGFDPKGVDGAWGRNTRTAIADWQRSNNLLDNGFMNASQISLLNAQSEIAFKNQPAAAPKRTRKRVRICTGGIVKICRYEWR